MHYLSMSKIKLKQSPAPEAAIGAVERETGLSKDTLRIWERRYGFPQPVRDSNGERTYPAEQVEKLRVIRRLMDGGLRPGKIVQMPLRELNAQIGRLHSTGGAAIAHAESLDEFLRLLKAHNVTALREHLAQLLLRLGLQRFVLEAVAPLTVLVGNACTQGRIEIFEEHLYSEQVQHLLRQALGSFSQPTQTPRVLLTTLPGEEHQLGLLMAQACLTVEGAQCISLGVQTPAGDIAQAARAHRADVVGLSFSSVLQMRVASAGLADLRQRLDRDVALWAGGAVWQLAHKLIPGVTPIAALEEIPTVLAAWRATHPARAEV